MRGMQQHAVAPELVLPCRIATMSIMGYAHPPARSFGVWKESGRPRQSAATRSGCPWHSTR